MIKYLLDKNVSPIYKNQIIRRNPNLVVLTLAAIKVWVNSQLPLFAKPKTGRAVVILVSFT